MMETRKWRCEAGSLKLISSTTVEVHKIIFHVYGSAWVPSAPLIQTYLVVTVSVSLSLVVVLEHPKRKGMI